MSLEVIGTKSRAERGYGDDMERGLPLSSIQVEELKSKCSDSDGMANGWVRIMGIPHGLETVYHAAAESSLDSKSAIIGVNVEVVGIDASMGISENLEVEGTLSLFSNIRDRLLGVLAGPAVDGRSGVEETWCGSDFCCDKLETG